MKQVFIMPFRNSEMSGNAIAHLTYLATGLLLMPCLMLMVESAKRYISRIKLLIAPAKMDIFRIMLLIAPAKRNIVRVILLIAPYPQPNNLRKRRNVVVYVAFRNSEMPGNPIAHHDLLGY